MNWTGGLAASWYPGEAGAWNQLDMHRVLPAQNALLQPQVAVDETLSEVPVADPGKGTGGGELDSALLLGGRFECLRQGGLVLVWFHGDQFLHLSDLGIYEQDVLQEQFFPSSSGRRDANVSKPNPRIQCRNRSC